MISPDFSSFEDSLTAVSQGPKDLVLFSRSSKNFAVVEAFLPNERTKTHWAVCWGNLVTGQLYKAHVEDDYGNLVCIIDKLCPHISPSYLEGISSPNLAI